MHDSRPLVAVFQMAKEPIGGVQRVLATVLPQLLAEFRIVVVDPYGQPEFAGRMRAAGLEVVTLGRGRKRRYVGGLGSALRPFYVLWSAPWLLLTLWRFWRWVRQHRPAVVYFAQISAARVFVHGITCRGIGLVYHEHGVRPAAEIGRRTSRLFSHRFHRVLAVSHRAAQGLIEAGTDPALIRVVYNAVDAAAVRQAARQPPGPLPDRPPGSVVFVHVASLTRHPKAPHLGIKALGQLPRDAGAQLWVCGDVPTGGDRSYLDEMRSRVRELGLEGRVHFLGWRNDVPAVLAAADVCILPSTSESFGMVLAEAMALGKPCIGSDVGGIPEVVEDGVTGLICEPTGESLARTMRCMLESAERRRAMGEAGRQRVEELFSLPRQAEGFADAFRYAIAAARGTEPPQ